MEEKDGDLMEQYCSTKDFIKDKNYLQNLKQRVIEIMSEYTGYIRAGVFRNANIMDELFLEFKINSELIKGKGMEEDKIVEKYNKTRVYFILEKENYYGRRYYSKKILFKQFIDKYSSISSMLCIFLKVISVFKLSYDEQCDIIERLSNLLKDFYKIEEDENAEYGYRVFPKHNIELLETTEKLAEKEPSLRKVLDFMYACDYVNALKELALLLEPKRKEYQEKIQKGNETLFDIDKFFNFVNNYGIRHNNKKQKQATEEQLKAHLDFGLSIYRLFTIYGDL